MAEADDLFLNPDDFEKDDHETGESWKPIKQHAKALKRKSIELLNLATTINSLLPETEDAEHARHWLMENAYKLPAKISGAMAVDDVYSIVMESAVVIKVAACELRNAVWNCHIMHDMDEKYVHVMRNEIDEFRKIFVEWVKCFDKENDLPDEWHLFNDPSTFPEDDEPFDPNSFFDGLDEDDK